MSGESARTVSAVRPRHSFLSFASFCFVTAPERTVLPPVIAVVVKSPPSSLLIDALTPSAAAWATLFQ